MKNCTRCDELLIDLDAGPAPFDEHVRRRAVALLNAVIDEFPPGLTELADLVRLRTGDRFHVEASAYARFVDRSWRDILLANITYDLTLAMIGCSTMALATADGPVLARNMDWWPEQLLARATYLTHYQRSGERVISTAGFPGAIGVVTGMSKRGFAVALNAVVAPGGADRAGYPVLLHLRRVLEDAASFDEARALLATTRLAAGALFTLVGTENHQRIVIERTPQQQAIREVEGDQPLITTNDYRALGVKAVDTGSELQLSACSRFDRLTCNANALPRDAHLSDQALLYCLTDPQVIATITAQHTIFRPRPFDATVYVPTRLLAPIGVD